MTIKQAEDFAPVSKYLERVAAEFSIGRLDADFTTATDAEAVVEEYFRRMDYDTFKLRGLDYQKRNWLSTWFDIFENFDFAESGVPDFFVCRVFYHVSPATSRHATFTEEAKVQDYRFIEVKSEQDDLRQSQLRWIGANPHLPVEVIVVE